jgi:hypothetical protein
VNEDKAREAVEHLQQAALEAIAAARALLDLAEDLVREPAAASALVGVVAQVLAAAARPEPPAEPAPRVTRIHVS